MSLKNPVTPPGIDPGTVRLVAQRLNHYPRPHIYIYIYVRNCVQFQDLVLQLTFSFRGLILCAVVWNVRKSDHIFALNVIKNALFITNFSRID